MTGAHSQPGPLRRQANYIIAIFLLFQVGLVLRATVPLPGMTRAPFPWGMFSWRQPWDRVLRATGIDRTGARRELPLHRIFGYTGGATSLYAYQYLSYLDDPAKVAAQSAFAAFLARRMAELGVELSAVDLRFISTNLDTGETREHVIGTFNVSVRP
ncbi:MAG TPA: hypothetical protein VI072_30800 [Polyangiaceae bacterium]